MFRILLIACACSAIAACGGVETSAKNPETEAVESAAVNISGIPAGEYRLDKYHSTLLFSADHLGYSRYIAKFSRFDARLDLDPADPASASLTASVDVSSLDLPAPPPGFYDTMMGKGWFDAANHPDMTFQSTQIELTGGNSAKIHGVLSLRGVEKPIVLEATFNGGYSGMEVYDPQARIGFSAYGTIKRSDFGMSEGIPPPGTNFGVGDDIKITIETEFNGPPLETRQAH